MKFYVLRPYNDLFPNERFFYAEPEDATKDLVAQLKEKFPSCEFVHGHKGIIPNHTLETCDEVIGTIENYRAVDEQFYQEYSMSKGKFLEVGKWVEETGEISSNVVDKVRAIVHTERTTSKINATNPWYYQQGKVECIDAIESAVEGLGGIYAVCVANVIKYVWRAKDKGGIEDYKKARWYLEKLIAMEE